MNNGHRHGVYAIRGASLTTAPAQSNTNVLYFGRAPINLVRGYKDKDLINNPTKVTNLSNAQKTFGYSDNWGNFDLCEPINAHFNLFSVGPIWLCNVLDPDKHRKDEKTTATVVFNNGVGYLASDTIILDTVEIADETEGIDYSIDYDYATGKAIFSSATLDGQIEINYYEVDPSQITKEDIIGGTTASGKRTGFSAISYMYLKNYAIPNIVCAPGWSQYPEVEAALAAACQDINGHYMAYHIADLPTVDEQGVAVDTIAKAKKWRADNGYSSEDGDVAWPMVVGSDKKNYHISTFAAAVFLQQDIESSNLPIASCSNKTIPAIAQYFGGNSENGGFDREEANELDEVGILTVAPWAGSWKLWGGHTAAYRYGVNNDERLIFHNSPRIMMYIMNWFQESFDPNIDELLTRNTVDEIITTTTEFLNRLCNMGGLIGTPVVEFSEVDNPTSDLVNGQITIGIQETSAPLLHSIIGRVQYTDDGLSTLLGGES